MKTTNKNAYPAIRHILLVNNMQVSKTLVSQRLSLIDTSDPALNLMVYYRFFFLAFEADSHNRNRF